MRKEILLEDLKKIEVEILKYVAEFCDENDLRYFLDSGTLLGAARHRGFIPWDDDIDIIMPRRDYEKMIAIFGEKDHYKILSSATAPDYYYPFAKVVDTNTELYENERKHINGYGVYIDIFPVDGLPGDERRRRKFQNKIWRYRHMWGYSIGLNDNEKNFSSRLKTAFCKRIGWKRILDRLEKLASINDMCETEYAASIVSSSQKYRTVDKSIFLSAGKLEFEGTFYSVPERYDEYLSILYGDYMKLPPKEQQVSNHSFIAYKKE